MSCFEGTPTEMGIGVCEVAQSYTQAYSQATYYQSCTRCGFLWLRRCCNTRTRYRMAYQTQYRTVLACCPGYIEDAGICTEINECESQPCQNEATCEDLLNGYHCECIMGFQGYSCETDIDECANLTCANGGNCTNVHGSFYCQCPAGYIGDLCETDIQECESEPCQHRGDCRDQVDGYQCECLPGFTGQQCETDIDECDSSPCSNNTVCYDDINGYQCSCIDGNSTDLCEIALESVMEVTMDKSLLYIYVTVGTVIVLVIIAIIIVCLRRRNRRLKKSHKEESAITELDKKDNANRESIGFDGPLSKMSKEKEVEEEYPCLQMDDGPKAVDNNYAQHSMMPKEQDNVNGGFDNPISNMSKEDEIEEEYPCLELADGPKAEANKCNDEQDFYENVGQNLYENM